MCKRCCFCCPIIGKAYELIWALIGTAFLGCVLGLIYVFWINNCFYATVDGFYALFGASLAPEQLAHILEGDEVGPQDLPQRGILWLTCYERLLEADIGFSCFMFAMICVLTYVTYIYLTFWCDRRRRHIVY
jgi:hypothetical protein